MARASTPERSCRFPTAALMLLSMTVLGVELPVAPPHVHIASSSGVGQGVLFRWRDSCFALTANHVLKSSSEAILTGADRRSGRRGHGKLVARFEAQDDDIALLRVTEDLAAPEYCGTPLDDLRIDTGTSERGAAEGVVPFVDRGGQISRMNVFAKTLHDDMIRIEWRGANADEGVRQGLSGSLVYIGEIPAGILIQKDGPYGVVVAMRRVVSLVSSYFEHPTALAVAPSSDTAPSSDRQGGDWLDAAAGAEVVHSSTRPANAESGAHRLLTEAGTGPWIGTLDPSGAPADIDFRLASETVRVLHRIEFELPLDQPPQRWPAEVEVFVSPNGSPGSWRSFGDPVVLHQDEPHKSIISGLGATARFVRLRLHKNRGDPEFVSLRRIRAY